MDIKQLLQKAGLSENEAKIYLFLLKNKESVAYDIARNMDISRPHVYDSLNNLVTKGVISYVIKKNKKHFIPADPTKVVEYLEEKEKTINDIKEEFSKNIPELKKAFFISEETPLVEVYEGVEAVKSFFNDVIKTGKEVIAFNTLGEEFYEYIPKEIVKNYFTQRRKKKIWSRQFYAEETKVVMHPMGKYKKLPGGVNPVSLSVYGDNSILFVLSKKLYLIKIKSKIVADLYRTQFNVMWGKG
ncbi:MAG: helix-turn-helix domain-containing protein [Candidatus Nanoarchaeia archaeon]|nr:helix-turn-helix domain-containing protein [Candidatus Nanoarchaeia archaeon]